MEYWGIAMQKLKARGLSYKHSGSWYLTDAVAMIAEEGRPLMLTKEVYPAIASEGGMNWKQVERNVRTALEAAKIDMEAGEFIRELAAEVVACAD